jgi:hypothetical protein
MCAQVSNALMISMLMLTFIVSSGVVSAGPLKDGKAALVVETYGDWSLDKLKDGAALALEYKQWITLPNNEINTASFVFVCDRRDRSGKISATLFPFDGTYNNQQDQVVVLIEHSSNPSASTLLMQIWSNGYKYIFLHSTDDVERLVDYLKAS